jgi:hypothetical protein
MHQQQAVVLQHIAHIPVAFKLIKMLSSDIHGNEITITLR